MLKLGKLPAAPRETDFAWRKLSSSIALPTVPSRFGHGTMFADWGMLGNDRVGDCVFAGFAHEARMLHKVVHRVDLPFTTSGVLSDYSAVTGYDPRKPATDRGTDVHVALGYRRGTGVVDGNGHRHKIGAYVALDPKNWEHLLQAIYIFGAVGIGFEFPEYAMDQFNQGQPWDVKPGVDPDIDGGHYVCAVGSASPGHNVATVSWAKRQVMTRAFYEAFNDEAYAYITPAELHSDGTLLHGFDVALLTKYLAALAD